MKRSLYILLVTLVLIIVAVAAAGTTNEQSANIPLWSVSPMISPGADSISADTTTPEVTPTPTLRPRSGEVETPMRPSPRPTRTQVPVLLEVPEPPRTPATPPATVPPTPALSRTTIPVPRTPDVTQPVVTVTVLVYQSSPVYLPSYYYPPGYSYPISSYYPSGSLTVTSYPTNAVVIVDGYNSEITPWVFTNVLPGYHTIEIDYPGYEPYITNVYVDTGSSPVINANLVQLQFYGSLFIDSTPQGADVYVDGNYEGTSPLTVASVSQGPHQVELHLAGYEVLDRSVAVTSGQGNTLNLVMVPYSTSSQYGSIDITTDIPGAVIYLDGTYKGSIPSGLTFNIISVSPGSHTLLLHVPGYIDFTQTVPVNAGQITPVNAFFSRPAAGQSPQMAPPEPLGSSGTQTPGSVIVSSSPSGGEVYLDNQFRGVAPVTIYNVAPGNHVLNMKLAGYADWSGSTTVIAGQGAQVAATFTQAAAISPSSTRAALPVAVSIGAIVAGAAILSIRRRK